jgi:alkanesulfonate monooxygenase SsuD/methylene tetrahydromethanopterin reductase-like flavin-dependent oxidoreductase (luciferase family)
VLLLPEHNPVVIAKKAASLDRLSGGRFILGAGIGWSAEEFAALGVPFDRRASHTEEYAAAMRTIWRGDVASFSGEFINFEAIRVHPKPAGGRAIPTVLGGNSDQALRRVARWGAGDRRGPTRGRGHRVGRRPRRPLEAGPAPAPERQPGR